MEKRFEKMLTRLNVELEGFAVLEPLQRMKSELQSVRRVMGELKGMVLSEGFVDSAAEIAFFREVKPNFSALMVLSTERYTFERGRPVLGGKARDRYYQQQLDYISRFFAQHAFLYEYYRLGAAELDGLYFVRGAGEGGIVGADLPVMDPSFSTLGDYLFGKFIAFERLREELLLEMEVAVVAGTAVPKSKKGVELRWTGDSCNLIELVYGIFDAKQLNEGQVDLSDIMEVLGQCFQIDLSRYFRRFSEIKRRKSISRTRFLDEMSRLVNKRIDDGDAYVPMSMR